MEKIVATITLVCFVSFYPIHASLSLYNMEQITKSYDDIKTMFQNEQYQAIVDKYANAPNNLSAEELTYIAQSYIYLDNLTNAQKYVDMAIQKDSKYSKSFYVKGIINNMNSQFDEAIENLKKAILLSPQQSEYYAELGDIYYSTNNYTNALINYRKAIELPSPSEKALYMIGAVYAAQDDLQNALDTFYVAKSQIVKDQELYVTVLYNIGNIEYDNKNYLKAIEAYQELIEYFPDDFYSLEKMVQCYNALKYYDEAESPKEKLYKAYDKGLLFSSSMSDMFCLDQFSVGEKNISAYERFENVVCRSFIKNIFYITDPKGNIEEIITLKYIPSEIEEGKGHYEIILEKGDEQFSFNTLFEGDVRYSTLQPYIINIVSGSVKGNPVKKQL